MVVRGIDFVREVALRTPAGDPVTQFAGAEWVISFYTPGQTLIYQTVPGDWAEVSASARLLTIGSAVTEDFPANNFTYNLDVVGTQTWRLIADGRGVAQDGT